MRYRLFFFFFAILLMGTPLQAAAPANTVAALWLVGTAPGPHGEIASAMPPRFALLEDGRVFVGGTSAMVSGKLPGKDTKAIEKLAEKVRKLTGLASPAVLGPGEELYRVVLRKGQEVIAKGDPTRAPAALRPLAALVTSMLDFTNPQLRPFTPESYVLAVADRELPGGCRDWLFPVRPAEAMKREIVLPAISAYTWPTGGYPASACDGDKRYMVTLRPLLPGETP